MKRLAIAAAVLALASALAAEAAVKGLYLDQSVQGAYNYPGALLGTNLFYRIPLSERKGILWESTKIDVGISNALTPAFDLVGAYVKIEPIAFFELTLKAQFAGYYDALGYGFRELDGYDAPFDGSDLDEIGRRGATGWILGAAPTLKLAYGNLAFMDAFGLTYFDVDDGEGYFFEPVGHCPLAKRDIELSNDVYLLWIFGKGIMAGLNEGLFLVPRSGFRSQTIKAVGALNRPLSERLSLSAAVLAGIYLEDEYLRFKPRLAGMVGVQYSF
jgi:hypothetical protein